MSHEIRTPMNGILSSLQLLMQRQVSDPERNLIMRALGSTKLLLTIINDILDFSKIEAGKLDLEKQAFDLANTAQIVVKDIDETRNNKDVALILDLSGLKNPIRMGDPVRIKQILINLLSNAIKFTKKGEVSLSIQQSESDVMLTVLDTGIGMSESFANRLFDRFSQSDTSTTREYGGTGLGLAITKSLVDLMHGKIAVRSKINEGTEINITLPLDDVNEAEYLETFQNTSNVLRSPQLQNKHILVVEDNPINQVIVEDILEPTGASVSHANNGKEAIEFIATQDFDLILMDIQMPVMDGTEAIQILRADGQRLPIIALTANVMIKDIEHYAEIGFDDHIAKPIEVDSFYQKLGKWLN